MQNWGLSQLKSGQLSSPTNWPNETSGQILSPANQNSNNYYNLSQTAQVIFSGLPIVCWLSLTHRYNSPPTSCADNHPIRYNILDNTNTLIQLNERCIDTAGLVQTHLEALLYDKSEFKISVPGGTNERAFTINYHGEYEC